MVGLAMDDKRNSGEEHGELMVRLSEEDGEEHGIIHGEAVSGDSVDPWRRARNAHW